jgi:hypothetical protein
MSTTVESCTSTLRRQHCARTSSGLWAASLVCPYGVDWIPQPIERACYRTEYSLDRPPARARASRAL